MSDFSTWHNSEESRCQLWWAWLGLALQCTWPPPIIPQVQVAGDDLFTHQAKRARGSWRLRRTRSSLAFQADLRRVTSCLLRLHQKVQNACFYHSVPFWMLLLAILALIERWSSLLATMELEQISESLQWSFPGWRALLVVRLRAATYKWGSLTTRFVLQVSILPWHVYKPLNYLWKRSKNINIQTHSHLAKITVIHLLVPPLFEQLTNSCSGALPNCCFSLLIQPKLGRERQISMFGLKTPQGPGRDGSA